MKNLYGYKIQFVQPLSYVPTRELYQAYRRIWRMLARARTQIFSMCKSGRKIGSHLIQPYREVASQMRIELMRRYGIRKIMGQAELFQEKLHAVPMLYSGSLQSWRERLHSDEVNRKRDACRDSVPYHNWCAALGIGTIYEHMRFDASGKESIDDIPF
jgi:hypothetical protein